MKSSRHFSQLKIKNRTKGTILNSFYGLVLFGLVFQPFIDSILSPVQAAPRQ